MKPVKRVFLILGAMSMFSLFQFDARGLTAYDDSENCTVGVSAGLYCKKKNSKPSCPAGCYCDPGKKDAIGENHSGGTIALVSWCRDHTKYLETYLSERGVHYCPDDFPKSGSGASSITHCHNENGIYYSNVTAVNCPNNQAAGKFCKNIDFLVPISQDCRPGCYCTGDTKKTVGFRNVKKACNDRSGATDLWAQLNDGHVYLCPEGFPYSAAGAKKEEDCFKLCGNNKQLTYKAVYCVAGKYLPKLSGECNDCPQGYRCPGTILTGLDRGPWFPSCEGDQGLVACSSGRVPNSDHTDCVCPNGKVWVADQNACVSRHRVTYNCGISGTGTPPADSHNYLVGETVIVKSKGSCQGPGGRVFDKWRCNSNNNIEDTIPGSSFTMPDADVVCTAQWTAGSGGGGNTGGNGTTCATGQYLVYGTAEPADITQRVDINPDDIEEVSPVSKRTNPNNNKAFAETNANNNKASGETKANLSRSVVSRAAKLTGFETSLSDVGQIAPKSLPAGVGGTCKDCDAGYYCPDKQHRYRCEGGTYTSTTGQTSCQPCNGTVTHPANNSNLNTGCSTVPDNPGNTTYTVTYHNVDGVTWGSQNQPTTYTYGTSVTIGTPSRANYDFRGWCKGTDNCQQPVDPYVIAATDTGNLNLYAQWACANGYVWGNGNICIPANNCDGEDQFVADDFCFTCPANSSVNETGDGCVNDSGQDVPPISPTGSVTCGLGEYVDDDGVCQTCPTGRFCPGNGNYYKCPFGSPTSNKASCSFSLNESKLYHGQSTSGNCWKHLNNASNYRDCMYGFHLESLRGN